jgi:hypothetical protein
VTNALRYASDSFPSQLDSTTGNGGNPTSYLTRPYSDFGPLGSGAKVPARLSAARRSLSTTFAKIVTAKGHVTAIGGSKNRPAQLAAWSNAVASDAETIERDLAPICWDDVDAADPASIDTCGTAVAQFHPKTPFDAIYAHIERYGVEPEEPPQKVPDAYVISSKMNEKVIDVDPADPLRVHSWRSHGGSNQKWRFYDDGTIRSVATGKCLDVKGFSRSDLGEVVTWDCHGNTNQQWDFTDGKIVSRWSGKCLDILRDGDANGTPIIQFQCHGKPNQRWTRTKVQ